MSAIQAQARLVTIRNAFLGHAPWQRWEVRWTDADGERRCVEDLATPGQPPRLDGALGNFLRTEHGLTVLERTEVEGGWDLALTSVQEPTTRSSAPVAMNPAAAELVSLLDEERDIRDRLGWHPRLAEIHVRTTELTVALAGRPS